MEEKFRKRALVGIIISLMAFCISGVYLASIPPERTAFLYADVDYSENSLDSLNVSMVVEQLNQTAFLNNYTLSQGAGYYEAALTITPKGNTDVEITMHRYLNDTYFRVDGFVYINSLGMIESSDNLTNSMETHMDNVLASIGHEELAGNLLIDDYFVIVFPNYERIFSWTGFLSLAVLGTFMLFYDDGYLIKYFSGWQLMVREYFGLGFMFLGIENGMVAISSIWTQDICISLWVVNAIVWLALGLCLIVWKGKK